MTAAQVVVKLTGPGDAVQAVPYLLGFVPEQSLVVIAISAGRVKFTARIDLGEPLHQVWKAIDGNAVDTGLFIAYADTVEAAHAALFDAKAQCQLGSTQTMWVCQGRYGFLDDELGEELPRDPSVATTGLVAAGNAVVTDRSTIVDSFTPITDESGLEFMWHTSMEIAPVTLEYLGAYDVDWDTAVSLGRAVHEIKGRDDMWLALEQLPASELHLLGDRLRECARRTPRTHRVPVLFLAGWAYWRAGNGATANIAVQAALALNSEYSAAQLLGLALQDGLDPMKTPKMNRGDADRQE